MSEPLKVGDLAIIVRDCCGVYLGTPIRVASMERVSLPKWISCTICKHGYSNISFAVNDATANGHTPINVPEHWLKKIEPPAIPEHEERKERITA